MVTKVLDWARRDLGRFISESDIEIISEERNPPGELLKIRFNIYTSTNKYTFTANKDYLGCIATNRTIRAGEDWHRGRDMLDGPCTERKWFQILADIVSYEMVKVFKVNAKPIVSPVIED